MNKIRWMALGFAVSACAVMLPVSSSAGEFAASDNEVLENASSATLFWLIPDRGPSWGMDKRTHFCDYPILSSVILEDAELRRKVISAFKNGVTSYHDSVAACFHPRHGLRVTSGKETKEFLICYECLRVRTDIRLEMDADGRGGREAHRELSTSREPEEYLNSIFAIGDPSNPPRGKFPMIVVRYNLPKNIVLTPDYLQVKFVNNEAFSETERKSMFHQLSEVSGKRLKMDFPAGGILRRDTVEENMTVPK